LSVFFTKVVPKLLRVAIALSLAFFGAIGGFAESEEEKLTKELVLVQLVLNNKLTYDSEILVIDGVEYVPIKQLAELVEIDVTFNRDSRVLSFKSESTKANVEIDSINKTIKVGETILDTLTTRVYWIKKSFFLEDDALIAKDLAEKFLDAKITYNQDTLMLGINVDRVLKVFRKKLVFEDEDVDQIAVQPQKTNFVDIRTLQTSYSASLNNVNLITNTGTTSNNFLTAGFNSNIIGQVGDGEYRLGPLISLNNQDLFFNGIRQSWRKERNKKDGFILGDSTAQFNRFTSPASEIFGVTAGSKQFLNFNVQDNLNFQGQCEPSSEVLLYLNGRVIARRICKEGNYNFQDVPRLIDPNSVYTVIQRNTDGVETEIRRDVLSFYSDLVPVKESRWQVIGGSQPLLNYIPIIQATENNQNELINPPLRLIGGGMYQRGLTTRTTLEGAAIIDHLLSEPKRQVINVGGGTDGFLSLFPDPYYEDGANASLSLTTRPKDNLFLRFGLSASNSRSIASEPILREGPGYAMFFDSNYTAKKVGSSLSLYYKSPNFYSYGGFTQNEMGGNLAIGGGLGKKNNFNSSFFARYWNLDERSPFGRRLDTRIRATHSYRPSRSWNVQNTLNFNSTSFQLASLDQTLVRTAVRKTISRKFDVNGSLGYSAQRTLRPDPQLNVQTDGSLGAAYRFGPKLKNQISVGVRQVFFDGPAYFPITRRQGLFWEGRFAYKKFVYQPSLQIYTGGGKGSENIFSLSNGLFYQQNDGTRLGIEYTYSNSSFFFNQNTGLVDPVTGVNTFIPTSTKTVNQNLSLNIFSNIGFFEGKPRLLSNTISSGYVKGSVYLDTNQNGKRDNGEQGIKDITLSFLRKPIETNGQGEFSLIDIPEGRYEISIDQATLPITLTPEDEKFLVEVKARRITQVDFAVTMKAGTISGKVSITNNLGRKEPVEGVVVIALDSNGKEVSYTYTDSDGNYTLSELSPGTYTVTLDKLDITKRNLKLDAVEQKALIPFNLNDPIEVSNLNFDATTSSF
jgi:hypothetical protein